MLYAETQARDLDAVHILASSVILPDPQGRGASAPSAGLSDRSAEGLATAEADSPSNRHGAPAASHGDENAGFRVGSDGPRCDCVPREATVSRRADGLRVVGTGMGDRGHTAAAPAASGRWRSRHGRGGGRPERRLSTTVGVSTTMRLKEGAASLVKRQGPSAAPRGGDHEVEPRTTTSSTKDGGVGLLLGVALTGWGRWSCCRT